MVTWLHEIHGYMSYMAAPAPSLFLTAFGDTPRRWLNGLRMQRAIELLRDGSNIGETAFCLGYEDPSHFSREFKKHYGFAPSENANPPVNTKTTSGMSLSAMKLSHLAMKS
jgi:AraC-like DNA-binding protein